MTSTPTPLPPPSPHVCDVRDPAGARTGTCHLAGPHGGPCPTCHQHADDCAHLPPGLPDLDCPEAVCVPHGTSAVTAAPDAPAVPDDRPLLEFVGMRTYGPDHPDRDVLEVRLRLDRSLDVAAVLGRLVEAVRDLDLELRTAREDPP